MTMSKIITMDLINHRECEQMLSYQLAYLKANYPTAFFSSFISPNVSAKSAKLQDYLVEYAS